MGKTKNFQFVWPKDGYKGRDKRGFWGRLNNILTDRGPDVFLQRKGSSTPIKPDWWGNWYVLIDMTGTLLICERDSYHDPYYHTREITNSFPCASRGTRRYDPQSRTYEHWSIPSDWYGNRVGPWPDYQPHYPRFTREEWAKINRRLRRGRLVDPLTMGKDWHQDGPKVRLTWIVDIVKSLTQ